MTEPQNAADAAFLEWWHGTQGTAVDDAEKVLTGLQQTAEGNGTTVPVPGVGDVQGVVPGVNGPGDDLVTAKLAEGARRGLSGGDLFRYAKRLTGETPQEIAASAVELDKTATPAPVDPSQGHGISQGPTERSPEEYFAAVVDNMHERRMRGPWESGAFTIDWENVKH